MILNTRNEHWCDLFVVYYLLLPRRHLHNHSLRSHCRLFSGILRDEARKGNTGGKVRIGGRKRQQRDGWRGR